MEIWNGWNGNKLKEWSLFSDSIVIDGQKEECVFRAKRFSDAAILFHKCVILLCVNRSLVLFYLCFKGISHPEDQPLFYMDLYHVQG